MKSVLTYLAVLTITAIAPGCTGTHATVPSLESKQIEKAIEWVKTPIAHEFKGRTVSLEVNESIYFFHQSKLSVYHPASNLWDHRNADNPYEVDEAFAANYDGHGLVYLTTSRNNAFLSLDIKAKNFTKLAPLPVPINRGARLASDGNGFIYAAAGHNGKPQKKPLYRYDIGADTWESLGKIKTVNLIGLYSSGLTYWNNILYAWGDHHISYYDPAADAWGENIFYPMRYRPAIGQGGMYTFDQKDGSIYVTLGKGSNSLAVLPIPERAFFYLRPRLPFFLNDDDDTLFVSETAGIKRLNVLSSNEQAIYSIELAGLERIVKAKPNRIADIGSDWEVHTVGRKGAGGELIRHKDSYTNMVYAAPYVYHQRKNILRRFNLKRKRYSWVGGCCGPRGNEHKFHKEFITPGAGIVFDSNRYLYLFTGHDQKFSRVDLWGGKPPITEPELRNPQAAAENMIAKGLANLPEQPALNTAMVYHEGAVWAVFDPQQRNLYRYDVNAESWARIAKLPDESVYDLEHGFALASSGSELFLFARKKLFSYDEADGWSLRSSIAFPFYADGGMVAFDSASNQFYVSVGNSSTALGVVDPSDGASRLLDLAFPDVVSVAGQRMFIVDGVLYISRGHNSAETWRIPLAKLR